MNEEGGALVNFADTEKKFEQQMKVMFNDSQSKCVCVHECMCRYVQVLVHTCNCVCV